MDSDGRLWLAAVPETTIRPLHHVQNAAAGLSFSLRTSDHITPSLIQLYWLPIRWRIQHKLCLLMHSVHSGRSPAYLADIVEPASTRSTRRLHSAIYREQSLRDTTSSYKSLAKERFHSQARPCGTLSPADIRDEISTASIRKKLRTFYLSVVRLCLTAIFILTMWCSHVYCSSNSWTWTWTWRGTSNHSSVCYHSTHERRVLRARWVVSFIR